MGRVSGRGVRPLRTAGWGAGSRLFVLGFFVLLTGCDPCGGLPCLTPECPVEDGPAAVEGQVSVTLGTLRRALNDQLLEKSVPRRHKQVPGVGTLSGVVAPAPVSLVPVDGEPQQLRILGTVPMHLSRAPERASSTDFVDLGRTVVQYEARASLKLQQDRGGWRLLLAGGSDASPEIAVGPLPEGLEGMEEAANALLQGLAQSHVALAVGVPLGRVRPWPSLEGPAQLAGVEAAMDGAVLRLRLTPRGRIADGLDLSDGALDPGAGQESTVALSRAWLSALASASSTPGAATVPVSGVPHHFDVQLAEGGASAVVHGRRVEGCGFAEVDVPMKIGRIVERWGVGRREEAPKVLREGGEVVEGLSAALAEASAAALDRRLAHPVFVTAGRRSQVEMIRYDGDIALVDRRFTPLKAPVGTRPARRPTPPKAPAPPR